MSATLPAPHQATVTRCFLAIVAMGLVQRLSVFLFYLPDLRRHIAANPDTLTWQYPTAAALDGHFWSSLFYWQQTPPLPVLILGLARKLFGWPHGTVYFCLMLEAVLGIAAALLMFRILARLTGLARTSAAAAAVFLLSTDLLIIDYNSFAQTFYEHLAMALLLLAAWSFLRVCDGGPPRWSALAGITIGLLALTRANFSYLFLVPVVFLPLLSVERKRLHWACLLLPLLLLQGGWALKNVAVHGHLSLSTTTWQGSNFLHGLQQVGLGPALRAQIEAQPDRYPDWFLATIRQRGLDPWPPFPGYYSHVPRELAATDAHQQQAMGGTDRLMNSAAQRSLSSIYMSAYLRFAIRNPGAIVWKLYRSYRLFWEPMRNYGSQYVALFFVKPVIRDGFQSFGIASGLLTGKLPEPQFVLTGPAAATVRTSRPAHLPALSTVPLLLLALNGLVLHLLLPALLVWAVWRALSDRTLPTSVGSGMLFLVSLYVYAALTFNLPEHGENMRFRLVVEPLIWILSLHTLRVVATPLVQRFRRP